MSYEFTKLGAVEALTEMPENANALVEVDGAIKRVPAGVGGGVVIVNVSCDMTVPTDGSDPTFANIVNDKTFAELKAAHDAGDLLWCRLHVNMQTDAGEMTMVGECPLYASSDTEMGFWPLGYFQTEFGIIVTIDSNNVCSVFKD